MCMSRLLGRNPLRSICIPEFGNSGVGKPERRYWSVWNDEGLLRNHDELAEDDYFSPCVIRRRVVVRFVRGW
jgi:hypothetical protein